MSYESRLSLLLLGAAACAAGTSPSGGGGATDLGEIQVQVVTLGSGVDPDGFTLVLDGADSTPVEMQASVTLSNLDKGPHSLQLAGLDPACEVATGNLQTVTVTAGQSAAAQFDVVCKPPGTLALTVTTTGTSPDPDGYTLTLSGVEDVVVTLPSNGAVTVPGLTPGTWHIAVAGVAPNCGVTGGQLQVVIDSAATEPLLLEVHCSTGGVGQIKVIVSTTSIPPAPAGFSFHVSIDGNPGTSVLANGSVTLSGISVGGHQVHLSVPSFCGSSFFGPPPPDQTVTVSSGAITIVTFNVFCLA